MADLRETTVIFVTYNSADCIEDAVRSVPRSVPVLIVDNASRDATVDRARAVRGDAQIEVLRRNIGYGGALNHGVHLARTPFVLMSNPDVQLDAQAIEQLIDAAARFPDRFLFSPTVHEADGSAHENLRGGLFSDAQPLFKPLLRRKAARIEAPTEAAEVEWVGGWVILARRDAFLEFGGFDENIFLFFEETDLCYRATQAGHPPVFVPTIPITHLGSASSGEVSREKLYFRQWHFSWSRFYLAGKYSQYVSRGQLILHPLALAVKRLFYQLLGKDRKAVYYAAQFDGALAALNNKPANLPSPWERD